MRTRNRPLTPQEEAQSRLPYASVWRLPFGLTVTRVKTRAHTLPIARALPLLLIGLALIVAHESLYRRTGGDDFELLGIVSHAGADMLLVVTVLTLTSMFLDRRQR